MSLNMSAYEEKVRHIFNAGQVCNLVFFHES